MRGFALERSHRIESVALHLFELAVEAGENRSLEPYLVEDQQSHQRQRAQDREARREQCGEGNSPVVGCHGRIVAVATTSGVACPSSTTCEH